LANGDTTCSHAEWKDEETDVAKYLEQSGATGGGGAPSHLWEDTWDDDDVEEEFSVQLRYEVYIIEVNLLKTR
jgi:hypothetical protein